MEISSALRHSTKIFTLPLRKICVTRDGKYHLTRETIKVKPGLWKCSSAILSTATTTPSEPEFIPDAIMVLAGGQTPDGGVPVWVQRRLDESIRLHNFYKLKCPIVCMGGGTPHRPPIMSPLTGHVIHEGTSCANYLLQNGVNPQKILKEWGSYDTIANGYFALVWHAIPREWTKLIIITSDFHMPRSKAIFQWIFGLKGAGLWIQGKEAVTGVSEKGYDLRFVSVSDAGIDPHLIQARKEKEERSFLTLQGHISRISTLKEFHEWFHLEHKAYNVADQDSFGEKSSTEVDPIKLCY